MNYKVPSLNENDATNNNKSKQIFSEFLNINNGIERIDARNMFYDKQHKKIAFAYCSNPNELFCRQFYDDAEGLIIFTKNGLTIYDRSDLIIDLKPNRVTCDGKRAYTAKPRNSEIMGLYE